MAGGCAVVVVGSFNVDHVWRAPALPIPGETLPGTYATGPGGKGFNQAVAASRAGAPTHFICALGDDAGGALARALAGEEDMALHATRAAAATGTAGIFVDADGRNSIVVGEGANAELSRGCVEACAGVFAGAAVVLSQLESPIAAVLAALQAGRARGATTLLNPAPAHGLGADSGREALLAATDVLTPNESEFALLLQGAGVSVGPGEVATAADARLHAWCRQLLPDGTVVVTLGAAGAFVSHADGRLRGDAAACYRVPGERAEVVDTTGAGDAFSGALAAELATGAARFADAARFAGRFAALSTQSPGAARAMPTRRQVEAVFDAPAGASH